ncbi:MAG: Ig-like domain-containing protein [Bacteroidales bacterium]|jgi:hypothetical protein|nr:Ig-like domain-containing protein [Bacteroidales bacterium]
MKKELLYFVVLFSFMMFRGVLFGQFIDDFSDGDFTNDPVWFGDESLFVVNNNFQLQLNDIDVGDVALVTESSIIHNVEWRFLIRMAFSPSNNNFAQIYLASDHADLRTPLHGYFLRFGEGGSNDAIELYKQEGDTKTLICRGDDGAVASSFTACVKVVFTDNIWTLYSDMNGGDAFQKIASGSDTPTFESSYFGVLCQYTKSNANRFYFDDFYVGEIYVDTDPPELKNIEIISERELKIVFSESITQETAENTANYFITPSNFHPDSAILQRDSRSVVLYFSQSFEARKEYTLTVHNISDLAGNIAPQLSETFYWSKPFPYDILITEIMARSVPSVGLPEVPYIEIFNNSDFSINLNGWSLVIGNSVKNFGDFAFERGEYLILCHNSNVALLENYGNCYGFSSFSLTYGGTSLTLSSPEKEQIAYVHYSDAWYKDDLKKDGGWSLERIDLSNHCDHIDNWQASINPQGGTPGKKNSVDGVNIESILPEMMNASFLDEHSILVKFNKNMNPEHISRTDIWKADHGLGEPVVALPIVPEYNSVMLAFSDPIERYVAYTLTLDKANITDCADMALSGISETRFAIPEQSNKFDIVINEVMFSPNNVQYVELYNRSSYTFDIKSLRFIFENNRGEQRVCSLPSYLLFPEGYALLTKQTKNVETFYRSDVYSFVEIVDFPTLATSSGIIRIAKVEDSTQIIDVMRYDSEMHSAIQTSTTGISLERISPDRPAGDETNWHSAAQTAGFGTPGYKNSQFDDGKSDQDISIDPEVFTPDNDGIDDYLNVRYKFEEPGYIANIYIYDATGRFVKRLANNATVGTEGSFSWDGRNESGQVSNSGIYIVVVDIFNLQGKTKRYKKIGTLGVRF